MKIKKKEKNRNSVKRRCLLHFSAAMILASVFAFSGMFGNLPLAGGETGTYEAFAYILPEEQETEVVPEKIIETYIFSTKEPIMLGWKVVGAVDGDITDKLGNEHCTFTINGKSYACRTESYMNRFELNEAIFISKPGIYDYTISFKGYERRGYMPCEYKGKFTVAEKKDLVVTASIPDNVPTGEPLPISGTLTDEDGNPMVGATIGFWVQGPNFNEDDSGNAVTDENGVWTYSGKILAPAESGNYYLANMWVDNYDVNKFNRLNFEKFYPQRIEFKVSEGASFDTYDRLELISDSVRKTYKCGEFFDATGLEVKGYFTDTKNNNYDKDLSDGDYQVMPRRLTEACKSVIIAYSVFGQTKTAEIPVAVKHDWDGGKVTKAATNAATGVKTYTCNGCKATKKETLPKLAKKVNPLKAKGKSVKVNFSKLKKKNQVIKRAKAIAVTGPQGKVTYKKVSVTYAKAKSVKMSKNALKKYRKSAAKKIVINAKNGNVTVKKGLKKGAYKVKAKVKAAGNSKYKASGWKTVTITIKVG